jgi:hypothetical protein
MQSIFRRPVLLACVCLAALACAQGPQTVAAQAGIPSSPEGTVTTVAENLANNHPEILWEALPESYRADINEITALFASKMDAETYDRAMALALNFVEVLQSKQDIILASNTIADTGVDVASLGDKMTPSLAIVQTFLASEISTLAGVGGIDWQAYLAGTVAQLMAQADEIETEEDEDPFLLLDTLAVEVLEENDETALLRITVEGEEPEEVSLVKVEDRWVPAELAEQWDAKIAEARSNLEGITPESMQEMKGQAAFAFTMAEGLIQQLSAIETPEDFDAAMGPMIEGLMQNIGSFVPDMSGAVSDDDEEYPE